MRKQSLALLASAVCFTALSSDLAGDTYYVTQSTTAGMPDSCSFCTTSGNSCCTLIDALNSANSVSGSTVSIGVGTVTYTAALSSPCTLGNSTTVTSSGTQSIIDFGSFTSTCLTGASTPTVFQVTGPLTLNNVSLKDSSLGGNVINVDGARLTITNTTGGNFTNNAWTLDGGALYVTESITFPSSNSFEVLSSGGNIILYSGDTMTAAGVLTGSGTLTIGSTDTSLLPYGTLALTGTSGSFTGPLVVGNTTNAANLSIASMASLGSPSEITLANAILYTTTSTSTGSTPFLLYKATFTPTYGTTLTIPGQLSPLTGSSYQLKLNGTSAGTGTTVLGGDNSGYEMIMTMGDGAILSVSSPLNLGNSSSSIGVGLATVIFTGSGTFPQSFLIGNASTTLNVNTSQTVTLSGVLTSTGTLNKAGSGTLVLTNTNTYSGGTKIAAGTLAISSATNIGGASTALTLSGGTLHATGNVTMSGTVTASGSSTITTDASMTTTFLGAVTGASATLTFTGSGSGSLSGVVTLNTLTVNASTLTLSGSSNAISTINLTNSSILNIGSGSTGSSTAINITNSTLNFLQALTLPSGNTLTLSGTNVIDDQGFNVLINSIVTGGAIYGKYGTGIQTLANSSNGSSQYDLYEGALSVSNAQQFGSSSTISLLGGTFFASNTLTLPNSSPIDVSTSGNLAAASSTILTIPGALTGSGTLTIGSSSSSLSATGTVLLTGSGSTFTGPLIVGTGTYAATLSLTTSTALGTPSSITLEQGTLATSVDFSTGSSSIVIEPLTTSTFSPASGTTLTIPGDISPLSGTSFMSLISGGGTVVLSGDNSQSDTITTNFTVQDSTLSIGDSSNLGGDSSVLTLNEGTLAITGTDTFAQSVGLVSSPNTINVDDSQTATFTGLFSGTSLIKEGDGTLILSHINSYSSTTISGGTLTISSADNIGGSSAGFSLSGGNLHATGNVSTSGNVNVTASGTITTNASRTTTLSGAVTGASGAALTFTGSGAASLSGVVTLDTATVDASTLTLSGSSNTISTINLTSGSTLSIGSGSTGSSTTLNMSDATLNFLQALTLPSGNTLNLSGTNVFDDQGFNVLISSKVTGSSIYQKYGSGIQTLGNSGNSSSQYYLYEGILSVSSLGTFGSSSQVFLEGGALYATGTFSSAAPVNVGSSGGSIIVYAGNILTASGVFTGSGTLTIGSTNASLLPYGTLSLTGTSGSLTGPLVVGNTTNAANLTIVSMASLGSPSEITLANAILYTTTSTSTGSTPFVLYKAEFTPTYGTTLTIPGQLSPLTGSSYQLRLNGTSAGTGTTVLGGDNSGYEAIITMGDGALLSVSSPLNLGNSSSSIGIGLATLIFTGSGTYPQTFTIGHASSTITVNDSLTVTLDGPAITSIGTLNKNGNGTLVLPNANTYSGGTKIAAGTLSIPSASSIGGSSTALTLSGGTLHSTGNVTMTGSVSASSSSTITTDASMTTEFTGLLTGSSGGILTLAGDGTNSLGQIAVNSGTFTINGVIGGAQDLVKTGSGTCVIADTCDYTGKTYVNAGTLEVNGNIVISGDPIVAPGAILSGDGTVADTIVYGAVKGGSTTGTLHVLGDLVFQPGGSLATFATPGAISLITTTGGVTIDPGAEFLLAVTPGEYSEAPHLILGALGGITGQFSTTFSQYTFSHLSYLERAVLLNLRSSIQLAEGGNALQVAGGIDAAITHNRQAVIKALESGHIHLTTLKSEFQIPHVIASLFQFSTEESMSYALNQLHPAQVKGLAIVQENNAVRVRQSVSERFDNELNMEECLISGRQNSEGENCCDKPKKMFTAWAAGIGDTLVQDNVTNYWGPLTGYRANTGGVVTGFDVMFADYFYAGALGAYTNSHLRFNSDKGTGNISTGYAGVYFSALGRNGIGKMFYGNLSVIGSWSDYSGNRNIQYGEGFETINLTAKSSHGGNQLISHADTGLNFDFLGFTLRPFDSFDYITQKERGYSEHNAGDWELTIGNKNAIMIRNELGLQFAKCLCFCSSKWIFSPKISWVREVRLKGDTLNVRFTGATDTFFIEGYFPDRSLVAPGLAVTGMMLEDALKFDLYYNGEFTGGYSSNSVGGQISYSF